MKSAYFGLFCVLISTGATASEMTYGFTSPSFNGNGFSSHALTIEQEEFSRKQALQQQKKSEADAAKAAANNTNLAKFLNNVESRIYAQLSLQLSNAMFSDGSTTGTMQFEGSTITWVKDTAQQTISLTIIDAQNNATQITVPIGSFKF
jgi:Type VIII secretion system (T8SS), CsgF protein